MKEKTSFGSRILAKVRKHKHALALAAIVLAVAAAFAFIGIDALPYAQNKSERVIVNDDYSVTTAPITGEGVLQQLQVKAETGLYGVAVCFSLPDGVAAGTVSAEIIDSDGNIAASSVASGDALRDNTFHRFLFPKEIVCAEDTELYLRIYADSESVLLWKSESSYKGFALTESGERADGTLALQYITRHVGRDAVWYYALLFLLSSLALAGGYAAIFIFKVRPETAFIVIGLLLGIIFSVYTPFGGAPDEYVHIASAYRMSNRILGVEEQGGGGTVTVRTCDVDESLFGPVEYDSYSFQKIWSGLTDGSKPDETLSVVEARSADVLPLQYISQALGVTLARLLHLNYSWLIVLGRLFNLLMFLGVGFFAVRLMPVFKTTLALSALLPMSMQLAASFSYDAYVLALSFLGIALVFSMAYGDKPVTAMKLIGAALVFALLAPAKAIYILLALAIFIVPAERLGTKKRALVIKFSVLAFALVFWAATNMSSVLGTLGIDLSRPQAAPAPAAETAAAEQIPEGEELGTQEASLLYPYELTLVPAEEPEGFFDPGGEILANGDSRFYYSISYILQNPVQTVRLLVHTIATETGKYIQSMLGTRLGELIVVDLSAGWVWTIAIIALLYLSVVPKEGEELLHRGIRKLWGALIFLGVVAAAALACVMWTPINYTHVFGIQGRYFLPALPLLLAAFENRLLVLQKRIDGWLVFCMAAANIAVLLNVFHIMALR